MREAARMAGRIEDSGGTGYLQEVRNARVHAPDLQEPASGGLGRGRGDYYNRVPSAPRSPLNPCVDHRPAVREAVD
ncbi:hypothetical protein GCM10010210_38170 [Pseudonocardia hydrocarbonoxydans]|uniref:Uncharacterized protein n=1 Tax=Pseudonocardia hydrocarbonoxydans TaxID=76726 RepID=A0A4Y3WSY3_9PSEU|nr:hypothetical protein PHY01_42700 [Pseudonocardia hydrocarbonoxydans]